MDADTKKLVGTRVRRIAGQVAGVERMLGEGPLLLRRAEPIRPYPLGLARVVHGLGVFAVAAGEGIKVGQARSPVKCRHRHRSAGRSQHPDGRRAGITPTGTFWDRLETRVRNTRSGVAEIELAGHSHQMMCDTESAGRPGVAVGLLGEYPMSLLAVHGLMAAFHADHQSPTWVIEVQSGNLQPINRVPGRPAHGARLICKAWRHSRFPSRLRPKGCVSVNHQRVG